MKKNLAVSTLFFILIATLALPAFAYDLPPPPEKGSEVYEEDFRLLHQYQNERTEEQCEIADTQSIPSVESFFGPDTGVLTAKEFKSVQAEASRIFKKVFAACEPFKNKYMRTRPYNADKSLHPCIKLPGGNRAYPSSHTAAGYVLAAYFAKKFPAKRDMIWKQGIQVGVNRLIGGVHHPSDVAAGRALGKQIADDILGL